MYYLAAGPLGALLSARQGNWGCVMCSLAVGFGVYR